jgi:hypothetical protein
MIQISSPYGNAVLTNEVNALEDIHLTAKNIVVYQREIASLNKELNQIAKQRIECRATGTTAEILSLLKDYFNHNLSQCNALYW